MNVFVSRYTHVCWIASVLSTARSREVSRVRISISFHLHMRMELRYEECWTFDYWGTRDWGLVILGNFWPYTIDDCYARWYVPEKTPLALTIDNSSLSYIRGRQIINASRTSKQERERRLKLSQEIFYQIRHVRWPSSADVFSIFRPSLSARIYLRHFAHGVGSQVI